MLAPLPNPSSPALIHVVSSRSQRSKTHEHSYFFFNDTATTEIYTLSLHDALPISRLAANPAVHVVAKTRRVLSANRDFPGRGLSECIESFPEDRKSTRLNSSHSQTSYAVFCLTKKRQHMYKQPSDQRL